MPVSATDLAVFVVFAAVSLALIAIGLKHHEAGARAGRRLAAIAGREPALEAVGPFAWLKPFESVLVLGKADRDEIVRNLRAAGYGQWYAPLVFGAIRLALTLVAAGLATVYLWSRGEMDGLMRLAPLAAAAGAHVGTKALLRWRIRARLRRVSSELPFMLDVMLLMIESGVSLDQSFRHVAQAEAGGMPVMRHAAAALVTDINRGMRYESALDRWADRLGVPGSRELASVFKQNLIYGTELAQTLRDHVREFTEQRVAAARESIGRKTTKMTVVMIVFMMPALFIVLAGPSVNALIKVIGDQ